MNEQIGDPMGAARTWRLASLYRQEKPTLISYVTTARILDLIAGTENGHFLVSMRGAGDGAVGIRIAVWGADDISDADVEWIFAWAGHLIREDWPDVAELPHRLQELVPSVSITDPGFPGGPAAHLTSGLAPGDLWPRESEVTGIDILRALASNSGEFRVHLAAAPSADRVMAQEQVLRSGRSGDYGGLARMADPVWLTDYVGQPVEARCLVGGGSSISPRLRAALLSLGIGTTLVERDPGSREMTDAWRGGRISMRGKALPVGAIRAMFRVPVSPPVPVICGVPTTDAPTEDVPIDDDVCRQGLRLGIALTPEGRTRAVRIAQDDQLLHTEVLGATGTGKSSLLTAWVTEAAAAGLGVSVIDPHGTLVTRLTRELPAEMIERTVVVRSADLEHPVPVNPLNTPDWEQVQDTMVQVLREVLDPWNQGFLGPVFERLMSTFMEVQRALVGNRASFAALPEIIGTKAQLASLAKNLPDQLARRLTNEVINRSDENYSEVTAWLLAKFQRLLSSKQIRAITTTGEDAVDVTDLLDQRKLLLVDLASPQLGAPSSQMLGEMWLAKHWAAMARRSDPGRLHLLIVDEAHLFGSGLLPRILAEGRKFGLGAVLAHQNMTQLTSDLQAALESTTSNVISFRTGPREAVSVEQRLGSWPGGSLSRLPRLRAAATLSAGFAQSQPFTLLVDHNARVARGANGSQAETLFAEASWKAYCDPYRHRRPLTWETFVNAPRRDSEVTIVADFQKWLSAGDPLLAARKKKSENPVLYFTASVIKKLGFKELDQRQVLVLGVFAQERLAISVGHRLSELMSSAEVATFNAMMNDPEVAMNWFREADLTMPEEIQHLMKVRAEKGRAQMLDWIQAEWLHATLPSYPEHVTEIRRVVRAELRNSRAELTALLDQRVGHESTR